MRALSAVPPAPSFLAPYKIFPGNQPSTTLLLPMIEGKLTVTGVGGSTAGLIAACEG